MALTREQKAEQLKELNEKFTKASSVIFTQYIGLTVAEVSDLRKKLREGQAEMKVAKKTLMRLAAKEKGLPEIGDEVMDGPIACIFSYADPLVGAQIAFKYAKDHTQVKFLGGVFEGKILSKTEAREFAQIPGRLVLLATFMSMVRSPLQTFAGMCSSPLTGFARALSEMAKKKESAPAA
jgi:large subunit ribosomal protein L10